MIIIWNNIAFVYSFVSVLGWASKQNKYLIETYVDGSQQHLVQKINVYQVKYMFS